MSKKITESHCNRCGPNIYHTVLAVSSDVERYEMLRCRGCGQASFRVIRRGKVLFHDQTPVTYFPPAIARREPYWVGYSWVDQFESDDSPEAKIPETIRRIMHEVYIALQNNSRSLRAMGIRATLEFAMIDTIGDRGKLIMNLDEFEKAGYLSERQRTALDTILDAGHAAIHRGWEPTDDDIGILLDVTESVIESVYLHEARAERLEKGIPKRLPRPKKP
jgi:ribosomal protein L37E